MKRQFYPAEIMSVIDESPNTKRFLFKVQGPQQLAFFPGQFMMLDMPIDSKISYRSYSISSPPTGDNVFELIVVLNPTGLATPYIWKHYAVGTIVPVSGPLGKFRLPETIDRDICFIATGTGIAPLRSMLLHILKNQIPHRKLFLVFGNRKKADILYKAEMERLAEEYAEFEFIPVLSREMADLWDGKIGYVHQVYEELFADKRRAYFYLCGWSAMLKEARQRLSNMGYSKDEIRFELYD